MLLGQILIDSQMPNYYTCSIKELAPGREQVLRMKKYMILEGGNNIERPKYLY